MWLAIVGYGIAFAGMVKLQGRSCGIIEAFQGKCSGTGPMTASAPVAGQTQAARLVAAQQQQAGMIGTQPIQQA